MLSTSYDLNSQYALLDVISKKMHAYFKHNHGTLSFQTADVYRKVVPAVNSRGDAAKRCYVFWNASFSPLN